MCSFTIGGSERAQIRVKYIMKHQAFMSIATAFYSRFSHEVVKKYAA